MNSLFIKKLYIILAVILLTILSNILKLRFAELTYIVPLIFIELITTILTESPKIAFLFSTIAFGTSYALWALSSLFITILVSPICITLFPIDTSISAIFVGILNHILIGQLFKIKRFKQGMPFLFNTTTINIAILTCTVFISFLIFEPQLNTTRPLKTTIFFALIILPFILIHWWQAQITKSYKQAVINRELESLRMELAEKEKQLAELSTRNEELGRLIHKDNKRIPAMEHAVSEFLIMDLDNKELVIEKGNALLLEIQKLSSDRNNMVTEIYARKYKHHETGITELDTMLNYMEKRAYGEHIKLSIQTAINMHDFVPNTISAEDLSHVLSDLLENAIIASKHHATPIIQLQFYQTGKDFIIEIADNGIAFEAASLTNFGLEAMTTHADTGGSGIGLMDIWKIKEKYRASLHISEYETNAPYTKKIALIFNKKNRYTISTTRKEELTALCKRTDLQIF